MRYALTASLAVILVLALIALRWSPLSSTNSARCRAVSGVSPITAYPGDEVVPAVSGDGAWVAFSWKDAQWENRAHFFGMCARMTRQILVDHARA